MATTDTPIIFGLIYLDPTYVPHDKEFAKFVGRVFEGVKEFDLSEINFKKLREEVFEKRLKVRLEQDQLLDEASDNDDMADCEVSLFNFFNLN